MEEIRPRFTISIVCHNNLHLTKRCIESVLKHSDNMEIIVTDNGSNDQTLQYLHSISKKNKQINVIRNEHNEGFGKPHNKALEFARGEYFVVLNNDIEVCPNWMKIMQEEFMKNKNLALCGVQGSFNSLDDNMVGYGGENLEYIEASCLMVRTDITQKHTLFSSYINFAYGEDSDLSLRMRELGHDIATVTIPIKHEGSATTKIVQNKVPLHLYHTGNHAILKERWAAYLKRRNFNYRIAIIRKDAHGDVLLVTPIIHALKKKWPQSIITVITNHPDIFRDNRDVHEAMKERRQRDDYEFVYDLDLSYENNPQQHIVESYAQVCNVSLEGWKPFFFVRNEDRQFAASKLIGDKWVVIHTGPTTWRGRDWPRENFLEVARILRRDGWQVAVIGNEAGWALENATIDLRGKTTLHQMAAVIERADLFVGIDSFPMHIAQAMMRPVVGIFGTINPDYRMTKIPFHKGVHADQEKVPCVGEHHRLKPPVTDSQCDGACIRAVTPEMVLNKIPNVLKFYRMQMETSKIRDRVLKYCVGKGVDIGCSRDKITPEAIGVDRFEAPEVNIVADVGQDLPFSEGEFDYVYSSHTLEDFVDTKDILTKWLKVLKKGGTIILYLPHADLYKGYNNDHKHDGFQEAEITTPLEELGCEIIECYRDDNAEEARYSLVVVAKKN